MSNSGGKGIEHINESTIKKFGLSEDEVAKLKSKFYNK
jgi:hypothetical protein